MNGKFDKKMFFNTEEAREAGEDEQIILTEEIHQFYQHEEPDVIIPYHIVRRTTWLTSQLLLVSAVIAAIYKIFIIAGLLFAVYITSIWHWYAPRFSTKIRIADFVAVFASISYGSYYSTTLAERYTIAWFVVLAFIAVVFAFNETSYYIQLQRNPDGRESDLSISCLPSTKPNTSERESVYYRTAIIHSLCVHVCANAIVISLIIGGSQS